MKKLPPYGRRFVMPSSQIVMLYIGEPQCWQAAKQDQQHGMFNHLVLPFMAEAGFYRWPVQNSSIVAIDFNTADPPEVQSLLTSLKHSGAREVIIRQLPGNTIYRYQFSEANEAA